MVDTLNEADVRSGLLSEFTKSKGLASFDDDEVAADLTTGGDDSVRATCDEARGDGGKAVTSGGDAGDDDGDDDGGDGDGGEARGGDAAMEGGGASGGSVATTSGGDDGEAHRQQAQHGIGAAASGRKRPPRSVSRHSRRKRGKGTTDDGD